MKKPARSRRSSIHPDDPRSGLSDEAIQRLDHAVQGYHELQYRTLAIVNAKYEGDYAARSSSPEIIAAQMDGTREYMFSYVREFHALGMMGDELYRIVLNELEGCSNSWELNDLQRRSVELALHKEIFYGEFSRPPSCPRKSVESADHATSPIITKPTRGRTQPASPQEFLNLTSKPNGGQKEAVTYRIAEQILGIGDRQLRNLISEAKLTAIGPSHRRLITVASLKSHLGY